LPDLVVVAFVGGVGYTTRVSSIARNAGKMSIAVFLSRILGLVRELVLAALFGAGMVTDAYLVAFRIPNLLRDLFAEGALSQAFVSVFAGIEDKAERERLARDTQRLLSGALALVCILLILAAPWIVDFMASGFRADPKKFDLTVKLTQTLVPFLYFVSFAALSMGILNSLGVFFVPSLGSAAFNLVNVVLGGGLAWYFWQQGVEAAIWGWAIGTLVAGFAQWGIQWPALRKKGFLPLTGVLAFLRPGLILECLRDPKIKRVLWIMAPAVLGVAATQINVFVSTIYATSLAEGSVSWLSYAFRLMHFPMGVFGVALSTATLPQLARLLSDPEKFRATLSYSMSMAIVLAIGASAGLIAFGHPIISWIYERGAFGAIDSLQTASAISAYSVGLIGFVGLKIVAAAYFAFGAVWIPSLIALASIGVNILGMELLSKYFAHAGLALSTALVSIVNLLVLMIVLKFKFKISLFTSQILRTFAASAAVAAMIFVPAFYFVSPWLDLFRNDSLLLRTMLILGVVLLSGCVYLTGVSVLRPEGRELIGRIRGKILRR
jgi:putative peptidoglycan lipid II flippase